MLVPQALARNRPRRQNRVSSRPSASTSEILAVSAASSAWPQRLTAVFTVCHTQPSSAATSLSGRPRPAWRVAHRAARLVRSARGGAISAACSVTEPAPQPSRGQRQRRLCHACLTVGRQHRPAERGEVHQHHRPLTVGPQPLSAALWVPKTVMLLCLSTRELGEVPLVALGEVAVVVEAPFEC